MPASADVIQRSLRPGRQRGQYPPQPPAGRNGVAQHQRLLAAGKPPKVAMVACMREPITILNVMMKTSPHRNPTLA